MNHLFRLFLALALLVSAACTSTRDSSFLPLKYRCVRVTDLEGNTASEWIAEGSVWRVGDQYSFKAVQRISAPPYPVTTKYPDGRHVKVGGPNVIVRACPKPDWLVALDRE